jgi:hypothetical protein
MSDLFPPELDALAAMARDEGLDMKPVLLRVLTDLFVATQAHSLDEVAQFRDIAGLLCEQVDQDTAAIVACKLAEYPHTPPGVGQALVRRGDDASRIVLADAIWLPRSVARLHAISGERMMAAAVAARADLDEDIMEILLSRDDALYDVTIAANLTIKLPAAVLEELLARGRREAAVARALLFRPDLTGADRAVLFIHADRAERTKIIDEAENLASLAGTARRRRQAPVDLIVTLETAAMVGDHDAFASLLALGLGVSTEAAQGLIAERTGEPLALAYVALGIPDDAATRLFMFRDPQVGHSSERVYALTHLVREVSGGAAERIVSAILGSELPLRAPAAHQPIYEDTTASRRPSKIEPAQAGQPREQRLAR